MLYLQASAALSYNTDWDIRLYCNVARFPHSSLPIPIPTSIPFQAIGDGGQGWGNAILYIFFSPDIRRRLFGEPFDRFLLAAENKFQELLETETMSKSVQSARVQGEQASLVGSENTITGGKPATGYGVKSYRDGSTTTGTSKTASHSAAGYAVKSHGDAPTTTSTNSKAFSQSVNINQR